MGKKSEQLRTLFRWMQENDDPKIFARIVAENLQKNFEWARERSIATVKNQIEKIRKGEYTEAGLFNDNGTKDFIENMHRNREAAKVFIPGGNIPHGEIDYDTPDFDDPLTEMIEIPESWSEINEPFVIRGVENLGVGGDFHFPYHDKYAVQACVAEWKRREVDGIYLNGDIMDYEKVSRYAQNPDGRYLKDEIGVGRTFLQQLRKMFPNIPIFFKAGNHERRLELYIAEKCPELYNVFGADTQTQLQLADHGITYVPEQTVATFGKLWIAHGHELGLKSGTINIARQVRLRVGVNIMFNHWHKNQTDSARNLADETHAAFALGCLCYLKPRYLGVLNQWTQGAATVRLIDSSGKFTASQFQIQDGQVI